MAPESEADLPLEIGHVLFLDIVGYSKLLIEEQKERLNQLTAIVLATAQMRASTDERVVRLPTGDGMALVFRQSAEEPARCALEIAEALRKHPELPVRMGIHSGPVSEVTDVSGRTNIAGAGINMAQRVMDCGDAGHILASQHLVEDLGQYARWKERIHDLGECAVKHGVRLQIANLYTNELGNRARPRKFRIARQRRSMTAMAVLLLLGMIAASTALFWHRPTPFAGESAIPEKSIAVLPFENLSEDKANAYFAAGIQDEVLTRLANLRELKVISKTSTRKYESRPQNLRTVGEELGVSNILEGSVQKLANEVHINVQLIKARTDAHLWAQSYDRTFEHAFAVEGEVAQAVANELKIALLPDQVEKLHAPPTHNPQAYDSFLAGQYSVDRAWEVSGEENAKLLQSAVHSFQDAVAKDPGFALAYAHLAEAELTQYRFQTAYGYRQQVSKTLDDAKLNIDRALQLAPDLAAAHAALGRWYVWGRSDYAAGLAEHRRAFAQDPHLTEAILGIAGIDSRRGQTSEAADFLNKALEFDPRNLQILRSLGNAYSMGRDYTRAREVSAHTLALNPGDETDTANLSDSIWKENGDLQASAEVVDTYLASLPAEKRSMSSLVDEKRNVLWFSRDFAGYQKLAEKTPAEEWTAIWGKPEALAGACEKMGEKEEAKKFYEQARGLIVSAIASDPDEPYKHAELGMIDAGLGLADEALAESHKAADMEPVAKNAIDGSDLATTLAVVETRLGRVDDGIKLLQQLLSTPGTGDVLSTWYLRLEPWWDPLRTDPRFQKLCAEKAK